MYRVSKIVSVYDQEIPQSQTADNPIAPQGNAAQPSRDTRKTKACPKALCAMVRGIVLIPTLDVKGVFYNVAGIYKMLNYPHASSQTGCGDHKQTDIF